MKERRDSTSVLLVSLVSACSTKARHGGPIEVRAPRLRTTVRDTSFPALLVNG